MYSLREFLNTNIVSFFGEKKLRKHHMFPHEFNNVKFMFQIDSILLPNNL